MIYKQLSFIQVHLITIKQVFPKNKYMGNAGKILQIFFLGNYNVCLFLKQEVLSLNEKLAFLGKTESHGILQDLLYGNPSLI